VEGEEAWLRARIICLRTLLSGSKNFQIEGGLRDFIADAQARLDELEKSACGLSKMSRLENKPSEDRPRGWGTSDGANSV
jgi:hypothetical protein